MARSKSFFTLMLLGVLVFTLYFYRSYLSTIFLALTIAYMLQPVYLYFVKKRKWGTSLATVLTFSTLCLFIMIPLFLVANVTIRQIVQLNTDVSNFHVSENLSLDSVISTTNAVLEQIPFVTYRVNEEALFDAAQSIAVPISELLRSQVFSISNASIRIITDIVFFIIFVITFIPNLEKITNYVKKLSPLSEEVNDLYLSRITAMSVAMIRGSIIIAFIQACATGLLLWITGVPYVFFFGLITFFLCLVPLGSGMVLIPAGAVFLLMGSTLKGVLLIAAYFLLISNIDNVVRPMLVARTAMIHPVLMLVSVFAGLATFGFWGFVYGPLVAIVCVTTLEIYEKEFLNK